MSYQPTKLIKWTYPDSYAGATFYDFYRSGFGQSRDSDLSEQSNFQVALERLGGESETVQVTRAGHWAVGWVEGILIHESDDKALRIGDELATLVEEYPVLDESDWSQRESDYQDEYFDQSKEEFQGAILEALGMLDEAESSYSPDLESILPNQRASLETAARELYQAACGYYGIEEGYLSSDTAVAMADQVYAVDGNPWIKALKKISAKTA